MKIPYRRGSAVLLSFATAGVLVVFLYWIFRLGLVRYFDVDEMAYLHWAHNVFAGRVPYVDFLLYVPPAYLYVLALLFIFFHGITIFVAGRIMAWMVFVGICTALGIVFMLVRDTKDSKIWQFLLPGLILTFLPIPGDKFLEIRPDNLAMLAALVGMVFQVHAFSTTGKSRSWFLAGIFYATSVFILPKALPQVAIGGFLSLCWVFWGGDGLWYRRWHALRYFIFGLLLPIGVFGVWMLVFVHSLSQLDTIIYSLTKLPFEVNRLGEIFIMLPDLFFYPNQIYYGQAGYSNGLIANHVIWLVGLLVGSVRLVTPFVPHGRKGVWAELLIAGSFILYTVSFMLWYPMRHAQYLIPIAVFVAYYAADLVVWIWEKLKGEKWGIVIFTISYIVGLGYLYGINRTVVIPKLSFTNADDMRVLTTVLTTIPKDAYVLDLEGTTIYFRDPYYVSSVPFGQWEPFLSRKLPSLTDALERTKTRYIYQGGLHRVNDLPIEDRTYIQQNFTLTLNNQLFIRK